MGKKKEKVKKEYTLKNYIVSMTVVAFIVFNLFLYAGNIGIYLNLSPIVFRYIPSAIMGFLITFLIVRSASKKLHKSDADMVKKIAFIAPVVVAAVQLAFQLISMSSTIKDARNEVNRTSMLLGGQYQEELQDIYNEQINKAINEAYKLWILVSVFYLLGGEFGAFLAVKKVDSLLLDDTISSNTQNENMYYQDPNVSQQFGNNTQENGSQNINWNL